MWQEGRCPSWPSANSPQGIYPRRRQRFVNRVMPDWHAVQAGEPMTARGEDAPGPGLHRKSSDRRRDRARTGCFFSAKIPKSDARTLRTSRELVRFTHKSILSSCQAHLAWLTLPARHDRRSVGLVIEQTQVADQAGAAGRLACAAGIAPVQDQPVMRVALEVHRHVVLDGALDRLTVLPGQMPVRLPTRKICVSTACAG